MRKWTLFLEEEGGAVVDAAVVGGGVEKEAAEVEVEVGGVVGDNRLALAAATAPAKRSIDIFLRSGVVRAAELIHGAWIHTCVHAHALTCHLTSVLRQRT